MLFPRISTSILVSGLVVLAACSSMDGGAGGSGGTMSTGSTTGSGSSTATGSSTGTGGAMIPTVCPDGTPSVGEACDVAEECAYWSMGVCSGQMPVKANCMGGQWQVQSPVTCAPLPADAACDPVGTWAVKTTGPYDPPEAPTMGYDGPFDLSLSLDKDGIVYIDDGYRGTLSGAGCALKVTAQIDEDCFEMSGQSFCTYIDQAVMLDLSQVPAKGSVTLSCWGECGFEATAPAEATKQP